MRIILVSVLYDCLNSLGRQYPFRVSSVADADTAASGFNEWNLVDSIRREVAVASEFFCCVKKDRVMGVL